MAILFSSIVARLMTLAVCSIDDDKPAGAGGDKAAPAPEKKSAPSDGGDDDAPEPKTYTEEDVKALRAEAKKHRLNYATAQAKVEENERALAALGLTRTGKKEPDPVQEAAKSTALKIRNALVRSSIAQHAQDAHNSAMLFKVMPEAFAAVTVDNDSEFVDDDEMKEAVEVVRKEHPYLFKAPSTVKTGSMLPPDKGNPVNGDNAYSTWKKLRDTGRATEAQEFYVKNRASIMAQMKANPNLI